MDYNDILRRYYAGETTLEEERALREYLAREGASKEERVTRAIMNHEAELRHREVVIKPHTTAQRIWSVTGALAMCIIIIICGIKFSQPTIYGYHNGKPITSIEEARYYGEQMFAELAVADYPAENKDLLKELFKFE